MARKLREFGCEECGATFWRRPRPSRPPRFCSKACVMRHANRIDPTLATRAAAKAAAVIVAKYRGTGTRTYVKENGRHQHRVVAERALGRPLARKEIVHHIDGNKKNNDPSNLMVTTQARHMREHGLGIPGVRPAWMTPEGLAKAVKNRKENANVRRQGV